ncbi:MAG TPA: nitrous oxide reductase accessory protein NosL [Blastocatellia bacterium]|nr:nitrous oxide reductase accessory protein NosL [Blastocatellia bacterium]
MDSVSVGAFRGSVKRVVGPAVMAFALTVASSILLSSCGSPAGAVPASAANGRCPVCGMMVVASDEWASEIYYKDGTKLLFESPGDLLTFYVSPADFKGSEYQRDRNNIERISVKDYQTRKVIDARQASLVYKSRVDGPMGPDFLPFDKSSDAQAFVASNGGQIVGLSDVTRQMVDNLRKN